MSSENKAEINNIKKKILKTQIIGLPSVIILGFGLYGTFGAAGNALYPLLNNKYITVSLIIVGAAIQVWQLFKLIPLFKKQATLLKSNNH